MPLAVLVFLAIHDLVKHLRHPIHFILFSLKLDTLPLCVSPTDDTDSVSNEAFVRKRLVHNLDGTVVVLACVQKHKREIPSCHCRHAEGSYARAPRQRGILLCSFPTHYKL